MPEVGGVGGRLVMPENPGNRVNGPGQGTNAQPFSADAPAPVGQPGPLGQPTGIPVPAVPGQKDLPDVLAGRDQSQMAAAERMRASGGVSATEQLLGLNRQPTVAGAFTAPPGNSEALRHMTPTMRRTLMRNLLDKQRARMRGLAQLLRRESDDDQGGGEENDERDERRGDSADALASERVALSEAQVARAREELASAARMLDLLDELLVMQDYTISQMGTFAQG